MSLHHLILFRWLAVVGVSAGIMATPLISPGQLTERPNIILINLDDADNIMTSPSTLATYFPNLSRFASEGVRFSNFHVTTPLCGPSRACLLKGQYAHRTGIRCNDPFQPRSNGFGGGMRHYWQRGYFENDLSTWMKASGYRTMMVGKFLHGDTIAMVPAGWDDFYSSLSADYYGAIRFTNKHNPDGEIIHEPVDSYRTTLESVELDELIRGQTSRDPDQPFFLYYCPLAPHNQSPQSPYGMVEEKYLDWWPEIRQPISPSFNEFDLSDKTSVMQDIAPLNNRWLNTAAERHRNRYLSMKSVDDLVARLFQTLEDLGLDENTYVLLTSDNGYCNGHHRLFGKSDAFNRSTNVPMYVWGPGISPGTEYRHLLAHIDLAPTIVDLAGSPIPSDVDGKSFRDLLENPSSVPEDAWRDSVLIENWETRAVLGEELCFASFALRMFDSVYVEWADGTSEFYDLATDPLQLENQIDSVETNQLDIFSTMLRTFRIADEEPETTLANPFTSGEFINKKLPLSGLAEDDNGVRDVKLVIRRLSDWSCWDGEAWVPGYARVDADVTNPGHQLTTWYYSGLPRVDSDDLLAVWARAYDVDNNYDRELPWAVFQVDWSRPTSTIEVDNNALQIGGLTVQGGVADERTVDNVRLVIRDVSNGQYWTGAEWVDSWTYLLLPVSKRNQRWSYANTTLRGRFYVSTRAIDDSGNVQSVPTSVVVRVE